MKGVLLINLGTPEAAEPRAVRAYLKEFLMDPLVIDIPAVMRWFLVHAIILPRRPKASAHAYQKVWTERGSPLLFHSQDLLAKVKKRFVEIGEPKTEIELAMRYGKPSIPEALDRLRRRGVTDLRVVPLYPQYSLAATQSSIERVGVVAEELDIDFEKLDVLPDFYDHPAFIRALKVVTERELKDYDYDHLLFSFHGVPERHVQKTDPHGVHCLKSANCCDQMTAANANCYRAQCYATARALTQAMGVPADRYSVSFQSRLGRTPWIKPYTDFVYPELAKRGVKKIAVISPSFVADCLETLEEIQIRGREQFLSEGGAEFKMISCLNSEDVWAEALTEIVQEMGFKESSPV